MDDVRCTGSETALTDCPFSGFGVSDCLQLEIVAVGCVPADTTAVVAYVALLVALLAFATSVFALMCRMRSRPPRPGEVHAVPDASML
jgi:hypothetical protein